MFYLEHSLLIDTKLSLNIMSGDLNKEIRLEILCKILKGIHQIINKNLIMI